MLKTKSGGSQFIGVNMWDLGAHPEQAKAQFIELKKCGVSVVRVFAWAGGASGMQAVLNAAETTGMEIIIAVGDFSNGQGGFPQTPTHDSAAQFYGGGYKNEYTTFAKTIAPLAKHPALKIIELANEPHCYELGNLVEPYKNWVRESAALFSDARNISIGQISGDARGACDYGDGFVQTNSVPGITMASGHHYNTDQLQANKDTLAISPVPYYIGEANTKGAPYNPGVTGVAQETPKTFDPDNYFLYPIKGLVDLKQDVFLKDLKDQGYEVNCTTMPISLVEGTEGFDDGTYLFDKISNEGDQVRTNLELIFDFVDAKAPNWRSQDTIKNAFTSLEDHLTFQDISTTSNSDTPSITSYLQPNSSVRVN
jgi:hypothetical protein